MAETLRGGLSLALSGFAFWSHDIGGFENTAPADVYKRWVAFGLLSSHSRLHGSKSYRVPWNYDDEACDVLRFFTNLKCRLMPYLYARAAEAHTTGLSVMRPMVMEFDDPACRYVDTQYMLGDSLLVAHVFTEEGEVEVFLPRGRWTSLISGKEVVSAGAWYHEQHDFMSLPLYVKENTLLPLGLNDQRPDYDYVKESVFNLYALNDGVTALASVPAADGSVAATLSVMRTGNTLAFKGEGLKGITVRLVNVPSVTAGSGEVTVCTEEGSSVLHSESAAFSVTLG